MFALLVDLALGPAAEFSRGLIVVSFALLFVLIVAVALSFETNRAQLHLRRYAWYRHLELLEPPELRFRGMVAMGLGVCSFAAMLTLELVLRGTPLHDLLSPWFTLGLGMSAVLSLTLGAAFMERAALLDG